MQSDSRVVVTFHDVRDAKQAYALLDVNRPPASSLQLYTPRDLAIHRGQGVGQHISMFEGQVLMQVFYNQNERPIADRALSAIKTMLALFGELKAIHSIPSNQGNLREFRVEFHDIRAAAALVDSTTTQAQQLLNVSILLLRQYLAHAVRVSSSTPFRSLLMLCFRPLLACALLHRRLHDKSSSALRVAQWCLQVLRGMSSWLIPFSVSKASAVAVALTVNTPASRSVVSVQVLMFALL